MTNFKELFEKSSITKKKAISSVIFFAEDIENDLEFIAICVEKLVKLYDEISTNEKEQPKCDG